MGDFNSHDIMWDKENTNKKKCKTIEKLINIENLFLFNNKTLHPATGSYSSIDFTMCVPKQTLDFKWKVHEDTCGSDHFPIILEQNDPEVEDTTPNWNLHKAN